MAAKSVSTRPLVAWVTSNADGTEHAVAHDQIATGAYLAQCGLQFVAAALVTPPLRRCTNCLQLTSAPTHYHVKTPHDGLLARWTSRLSRLLWPPAAVSQHPEDVSPASPPDESHDNRVVVTS
ncbi:MAG: hypothetical protein ACRDSR_11360 [Pseudonocardiaceae bacterium]